MGSSTQSQSQVQVQCSKQLRLRVARMHDVNIMIIDDMRDYFKYIESKEVESAKVALNDIFFHCNTMIVSIRAKAYAEHNPKTLSSLIKQFEALVSVAPKTNHIEYLKEVGLPPFEDICNYYINVLNNKVEFKELKIESSEEDMKKEFLIGLQVSNLATFSETEKQETLDSGKCKDATEIMDMVEKESDAFDDCTLQWPSFINKKT